MADPNFAHTLTYIVEHNANGAMGLTDRGFVLHTNDKTFQATVQLDGLALSTSQDVLFAIADGVGPAQSLITLGYAGWEAG
uniref:Cadherin domain-containing protein n=1 Tax=Steinernema glaseri TaxID=37863 RepID=A0A1I7YB83_9BILA